MCSLIAIELNSFHCASRLPFRVCMGRRTNEAAVSCIMNLAMLWQLALLKFTRRPARGFYLPATSMFSRHRTVRCVHASKFFSQMECQNDWQLGHPGPNCRLHTIAGTNEPTLEPGHMSVRVFCQPHGRIAIKNTPGGLVRARRGRDTIRSSPLFVPADDPSDHHHMHVWYCCSGSGSGCIFLGRTETRFG